MEDINVLQYSVNAIDYANRVIDFTGKCADVQQVALMCIVTNVHDCKKDFNESKMALSLLTEEDRSKLLNMLISNIKLICADNSVDITATGILFIISLAKSLLINDMKINQEMNIQLDSEMQKEQDKLLSYWIGKIDFVSV